MFQWICRYAGLGGPPQLTGLASSAHPIKDDIEHLRPRLTDYLDKILGAAVNRYGAQFDQGSCAVAAGADHERLVVRLNLCSSMQQG